MPKLHCWAAGFRRLGSGTLVCGALGWGAFAWALLAPLPARAAHLMVPLHDAAGATDRLFAVDLDTGAIDELVPRRGGLMLEVRRLGQNLFADIGRPADNPARPGEFLLEGLRDRGGRTRALLLIETTTGYAAYLLRPGQGGRLGEVRTLGGRPASPLAGEAGGFVLLVRRDGARRGDLAYLVRGDTGGCLLFSGLERVEEDPAVRPCTGVEPPLGLGGTAAAVETASGTTTAFLVVDEAEGRVVALEPAGDRDDRLATFRTGVALAAVFPPPAAAGSARPLPRFTLAAVRGGEGGTEAAVALDGWSGRLALLRNVEARSRLAANLLPPDLAPLLGGATRGRSLAAVPRLSSTGRTAGLWILAGPRTGAAYLADPGSPEDLALRRVELRE